MTNPGLHDPSFDYPPSRPTPRMLLLAAAVAALAVVLVNWSQVRAFAHVAQIEREIEHAVGL